MAHDNKHPLAEQIRGDMYGMESMKWYGWGSPVGMGLGMGLLLVGIGAFLWLLHVATIIH